MLMEQEQFPKIEKAYAQGIEIGRTTAKDATPSLQGVKWGCAVISRS